MQHSAKKQEILQLAADLFASRGYDAVSMRDLGKALHMTPASLYHHFADKEQLYRETLMEVFSNIDAVLTLPQEHDTPQHYLKTVVRNIITLLLKDSVFTRLMFRELAEDNSDRTAFLARQVLRPLYAKISTGLASLLAPADPRPLTDALVSSVIGYVHMSKFFSLLHGDPSYEADREAITGRIMLMLEPLVAAHTVR